MTYEEVDFQTKRKYFETNLKAAQIGFVEAINAVAKSYLEGKGVEQNIAKSITWFQKAVCAGDVSAAVALGEIYYKDDVEKSIEYLSLAADKNHIKAIEILAKIYKSRNELDKMFACYQRGANLGNFYFMRDVAKCYLNGRGVQQDDLKALECYIKLIERSYRVDDNDIRLATKIYNSHFEFANKKFCDSYYITTKKVGKFNALFGIAAELYKTDKYRALMWYKLADEAGDLDAAVAVTHICNSDLDVGSLVGSNHYDTALKWYEKAAEFGDINAAKNLVLMYRGSVNVPGGGYLPNVEKCTYWLEKVLEMERGFVHE